MIRILGMATVLFSLLLVSAQVFAHSGNNQSDPVACCLFGSVAGTPGGMGGNPSKFCENPDINFIKDSGRIGDQLFVPKKCDKITAGPDGAGAPILHDLGKVGVSCHFASRGFRVMCSTAARAGCKDETCGKVRKAAP